MVIQTLITDYYKPIRGGLSLFSQFDLLIHRKVNSVKNELQSFLYKPKTLTQTHITEYYSTILNRNNVSNTEKQKYITDYFNPIHTALDSPNGK